MSGGERDTLLSLINLGANFESSATSFGGSFDMTMKLANQIGQIERISLSDYEFLSKLVATGKERFTKEELVDAASSERFLEYNLMDVVPTFLSEDNGVYRLDKRNLGEFELTDYYNSIERLKRRFMGGTGDVCPHCGYRINRKH